MKKILPLIILIVVLAGCIIGYAIARNSAGTNEDAEESVTVLDKSNRIVTHLEIGDLVFDYVDDAWTYAPDEHFPLDQEKLIELTTSSSTVTASLKLDEKEVADYYAQKAKEYGTDVETLKASVDEQTLTEYLLSEKVQDFVFENAVIK